MRQEGSHDLPLEFRAFELALELTCMSLDSQVKELENEIYLVLDELTSSIITLNLERVRRLKGHLLALTQRVQKVCDEIEHLMDDDGDMAEMYLTEKKERNEAYAISEQSSQGDDSGGPKVVSKSAPVLPVASSTGDHKLQRAFSCLSSSKHGTILTNSSTNEENIDQLEMLLEAYFVFIDNTLNKLLSSLPRSISDATFGRMSSLLNSMSVLSPREDVKGPMSRQNSSSDLISRDMEGSLKPRRVAFASSDMGIISSQPSSASGQAFFC